MTQTEEIKNEVARKYCRVHNMPKHSNWADFHYDYATNGLYETIEEAINEAITLYHKRLLEEAGKELPDINIIQNYIANKVMLPSEPSYAELLKAIEWMRSQASLLLASQKEEMYKMGDAVSKLMNYISEKNDEIAQLKEEIERMKEILKSAGVFNREDVNPEFLKIIDGIEENLKRKPKK